MSQNTITLRCPRDTAYDVLADPASYALWVVGNKSIRGYDRSWPAAGSEFQHSVGFGSIAAKDKTVALASGAPRRLVMLVRAMRFMRAKVSFTLEPDEPDGSRTRVTMDEQPSGPPSERMWNPVLDTLTGLRNGSSLRRLRQLAQVRAGVVHR